MVSSLKGLVAAHPYASDLVGGVLGAVSAIGAKKLAPLAYRCASPVHQKVSDIWTQKKIQELNALLCNQKQPLEKRTSAARTIIHMSKDPSLSKKALSTVTVALGNIMEKVDTEHSLQIQALERLLYLMEKEISVETLILRIPEDHASISQEEIVEKTFEILSKPWLSTTENFRLHLTLHHFFYGSSPLKNRIVEKYFTLLQNPVLTKDQIDEVTRELQRCVEFEEDPLIQNKALDGMLEFLQQPWVPDETFSSILFSVSSLFNSSLITDPSIKTKIVEGFIHGLFSCRKPETILSAIVYCHPDSLDTSLRSRMVEGCLTWLRLPEVPLQVKRDSFPSFVHMIEQEPESSRRDSIFKELIALSSFSPAASDEDIRNMVHNLKSFLIQPSLSDEQRNQVANILIGYSTMPSHTASTMETIIRALGTIVGMSRIHPALRTLATHKIIELSQSKDYIEGIAYGLKCILSQKSAAPQKLLPTLLRKLIEYARIPRLPVGEMKEVGFGLACGILLEPKKLRPIQIQACETLIHLSKRDPLWEGIFDFQGDLGDALLVALGSTSIPLPTRMAALDRLLVQLQRLDRQKIANLISSIIVNPEMDLSLRIHASSALITFPSGLPSSLALCNVVNTMDMPLHLREEALRKVISFSLSQSTPEDQLSRIVEVLCTFTTGRAELGINALEPPLQGRVRTALQSIAQNRPHFRETIRDRLTNRTSSHLSGTARMAQNRQNVHLASVHASVADSLRRLEEKFRPFDEKKVLENIQSFLKEKPMAGVESMIADARACFDRLQEPSIANYREGITQFTIQKVLCLVWLGGIDTTSNPQAADLEKNKRIFIRDLYIIQNQYAKGHPSCVPGTFNQLVDILEGCQEDVKIDRIDKQLVLDTCKEVMYELFSKEPLPIQKSLLKGDTVHIEVFSRKMRDTMLQRLAFMKAKEDKNQGVIFQNLVIVEKPIWDSLFSVTFLKDQLTISHDLVKIILSEVVKTSSSSLTVEEKRILRNRGHENFLQILGPFADHCKSEVIKRLELLGASFSTSKGGSSTGETAKEDLYWYEEAEDVSANPKYPLPAATTTSTTSETVQPENINQKTKGLYVMLISKADLEELLSVESVRKAFE